MISGSARYEYEHGIEHTPWSQGHLNQLAGGGRISMTLRRLRPDACEV
jgi:hypothetical protein